MPQENPPDLKAKPKNTNFRRPVFLSIILFAVTVVLLFSVWKIFGPFHIPGLLGNDFERKIATQSANAETASWKTYTTEKALTDFQPGEKYKYSLKYPPDWTFQENGSTTYFLPPGVTYEKNNINNGIYISVRDNRSTRPPVNIEYKTLREVKIENETAKVLQAENLATEKYLVEIARSFYMIRFSFSQHLDSKYDGIFDKILSSFKFL